MLKLHSSPLTGQGGSNIKAFGVYFSSAGQLQNLKVGKLMRKLGSCSPLFSSPAACSESCTLLLKGVVVCVREIHCPAHGEVLVSPDISYFLFFFFFLVVRPASLRVVLIWGRR